MAQTIAEGWIEQGRVEGQLQTHRDILRRLLLRKFPQLPQTILQRIESCPCVEHLQTAIDQVLDMKSVDEFEL